MITPCGISSSHLPEVDTTAVLVGLDIGSTTVKVVVVHPVSREIVCSRYRRHFGRQRATAADMLTAIETLQIPAGSMRISLTGSGGRPLADGLGVRFLQEVNAVSLAVEARHADVRSVIELGGQDAKVIRFEEDPHSGQRLAHVTMNERCASGTGATLDRCLARLGMSEAVLAARRFDPRNLHRVASKCGVFAETDLINLMRAGTPTNELACSLVNSLVARNLSTLTRGHILRPAVLLLGGPNAFLPLLEQCWRLRIRESWRARGIDTWQDEPMEQRVYVPCRHVPRIVRIVQLHLLLGAKAGFPNDLPQLFT